MLCPYLSPERVFLSMHSCMQLATPPFGACMQQLRVLLSAPAHCIWLQLCADPQGPQCLHSGCMLRTEVLSPTPSEAACSMLCIHR